MLQVSENSQVMPEEADKLPGPLVNEMQGAGTANLTLTIRGKAQVISVTQISNLSLAEFTKLYSVSSTSPFLLRFRGYILKQCSLCVKMRGIPCLLVCSAVLQ